VKTFDPTSLSLGITDAELREEENRIKKKPAPGDPFGGIREMIAEGGKSHLVHETQRVTASQPGREDHDPRAMGVLNPTKDVRANPRVKPS
jgi:hypothetical protein